MDEWLVESLKKRDIEQVVMLGAGHDSRVLRFSECFEGVKVFELDHPATQKRKKELLISNFKKIPENVNYVSIDLSYQKPLDELVKAGFDSNKKNIFILEGLIYYLPEEEVRKIFEFVKQNSCVDSEIIFDYFSKDLVDGTGDINGSFAIRSSVEKSGEPFLFGIEESKLECFIESFNMTLSKRSDHQVLKNKYFQDRKSKVFSFAEICLAKCK
ncbi:MAG: class I SAM-dependent methyltransferase [Bacteriovoracaceae bacterium]|nr:class I SAM-dependent methyltransferase [Bacteriovoracaceae bacterium]